MASETPPTPMGGGGGGTPPPSPAGDFLRVRVEFTTENLFSGNCQTGGIGETPPTWVAPLHPLQIFLSYPPCPLLHRGVGVPTPLSDTGSGCISHGAPDGETVFGVRGKQGEGGYPPPW